VSGASGPIGPHHDQFEGGMAFLAAALAVEQARGSNPAAVVTAAGEALRCFLSILEVAAEKSVVDPEELSRLRGQCEALLTLHQSAPDAARHCLEAALLARDAAAEVVPKLMN